MSENDIEHYIKIESTQVYRGWVSPGEARLLTGDGVQYDSILREQSDNVSFDLEFQEEVKLTFECACGRRFRKPETAREHLEQFVDTDRVSCGRCGKLIRDSMYVLDGAEHPHTEAVGDCCLKPGDEVVDP